MVPGRRIVETHIPNNFFRRMVEIVTLEPEAGGTLANFTAEYETKGFKSRILDFMFVRRSMDRNFAVTFSNLEALIRSRAGDP
ncbi:MAG: hypothetical protein QW334_03850 [Thermofilum sp.]